MIGIISLILDLVINKIISNKSIFLPLLSIISIIYIRHDHKYYYKVLLLGLVYDILFSYIYFINVIIFFIIGFLLNKILKRNELIYYIFISILVITIYQLLLYIFLYVLGYNSYSFNELLYIFYHYYLLNIIYSIIIYYIKIRPLK